MYVAPASISSLLSISINSPSVGVSLFQTGGVLIGNGGGLCPKNGLNGKGGYTGSGAVGLFSSISDMFSDLFVPSLLSRRQLASRLVVGS